MTRYRFRDAIGDIVAEEDFPDHDSALAWAVDEDAHEEDLFRVEYLGPDGDWRWAGPLPV